MTTTPPARISRRTYRLLRHGDRNGRHQNPFAVWTAVVWGCAVAGWNRAQILAVLDNPNNAGAAWWHNRTRRHDALKTLDRQIDAARSAPRNHRPIQDRSDVIETADRVIGYAIQQMRQAKKGEGRTSGVDLAALDVWAAQAIRHRCLDPIVPVRTVAEGIGTPSIKTAQRALHRLVHRWGALARASTSNTARGVAYEPTAEARRYQQPSVSGTDLSSGLGYRGRSVPPTATHARLDTWRHRDLGKSAWLIYRTLTDHDQTRAELAAATGKASATITRALDRLTARGLAVHTERNDTRRADGTIRHGVGCAWTAGTADPAKVAADHVRGRGVLDAERFAGEREGFARIVAARRGFGVVLDPDDGKVWWVDPETGEVFPAFTRPARRPDPRPRVTRAEVSAERTKFRRHMSRVPAPDEPSGRVPDVTEDGMPGTWLEPEYEPGQLGLHGDGPGDQPANVMTLPTDDRGAAA